MFFLSVPLLDVFDMFEATCPVPTPDVRPTGITGETGGSLVVICKCRSPTDLLAGGGGVIPCVPLVPAFWTAPIPRPPTDLLDRVIPGPPPPVAGAAVTAAAAGAVVAGVAEVVEVAVAADTPLVLFKLPNLDLSFPDDSGRTTTPSLFPKPATRLVGSLDTIGWTWTYANPG
jgi:hypothetical protein